jgi:hypothetical protein
MKPLLLLASFLLFTAPLAQQALALDIVVNTLAGDNDGSCDPGGTGPDDDCSLLEALELANASPDADVIHFSVSGTITPVDTPTILSPVTLDGTTAPGGTRSVTISREVVQNGFEVGVLVSGASAAGSVVRGLNFRRTLLGSLGNSAGVRVEDAPNVVVGGSGAADGNGFLDADFAVQLVGAGSSDAVVRGNVITGNNQGSFDFAISVQGAPNATIGGPGPNDGNTMSQVEFGISISGSASSGFSIVGNRLTNVSEDGIRLTMGMTSGLVVSNTLTNNFEGIVTEGVSGIQIGGAGVGEGNTITGGSSGMLIRQGSSNLAIVGNAITGSNSFGIRVQNVASSGNTLLGNTITGSGFVGVAISGAPNTVVGGAGPGEGNVIVDSAFAGIVLQSSGAAGARIRGNEITGAGPYGVLVDGTSTSIIGGTGSGEGNVIAGAAAGIVVWDTDPIANAILGNSITTSGALGIDLSLTEAGDGVTPNDGAPDADTGPNGFQNYPDITAVDPGVAIAFSLASTPSTTFRIEAFANTQPTPSGFGPGERLLGFVEVTTDASGNATGTAPAAGLTADEWATLTATAVDIASPTGFGGTSEFSQAAQSNDTVPSITLTAAPVAIAETGGTTTITATLSAPAVGDIIINLAYSGAAQQNVDFTAPAAITILDGQTTGTATLTALDDGVAEPDEVVLITIASIVGNAVDQPPPEQVSVTILDGDGGAGPGPGPDPGPPGSTDPIAVPGLLWPMQMLLFFVLVAIGGRALRARQSQ